MDLRKCEKVLWKRCFSLKARAERRPLLVALTYYRQSGRTPFPVIKSQPSKPGFFPVSHNIFSCIFSPVSKSLRSAPEPSDSCASPRSPLQVCSRLSLSLSTGFTGICQIFGIFEMQHCGNDCDCVYSKGLEIILPAA